MRNLLSKLAAATVVAGSLVAAPGAAPAGAVATPGGCALVAGVSCQFVAVAGVGTLTVVFPGGGETSVVVNGLGNCPPIAAMARSDQAGVMVVAATYQFGCTYEVSSSGSPLVTAVAEG